MPPKKQKKLRKPRANKRSGKPQPLPRSVQALLQYLGGTEVKLASSRPQRAQVAQTQQQQQQQMQYAAAISGAPTQAPAAISGAAPKAPTRPRGRPKGTGNAKAAATLAPAISGAAPKAPARPRGRPKKIGDFIAPSPLALAGIALQPQQIIMQQSAQQQLDTKKMEESQKQIQTEIAAIKVKQEKNNKKQTPIETLAFFQQKADFPQFMGQFPTKSEFSAAAKQPSLTGTFFSADENQSSLTGTLASAEPNTPSRMSSVLPQRQYRRGQMLAGPNDTTLSMGHASVGTTPSAPSSRRSVSSAHSFFKSMFEEQSLISPARYQGMMNVRPPSSQASSVVFSGGGGAAPDTFAPAASNIGEHLAQQFIQNVASPEKLATKKLRGRPAKVKTPSAAAMKFEGQTAEQAIATFQAAKPARKPYSRKTPVALPQGVDPSTQVQMLASGGAAAAAPKQRRGQSLKDLAKGGE